MAILIRIVSEAFMPIFSDWQQIIVFVSIASMALGSFAAIGQRNIKRLMAYYFIGHMGFALVGLAAGTETGVSGGIRTEEHTYELQSLMRKSYAVCCLKKKIQQIKTDIRRM